MADDFQTVAVPGVGQLRFPSSMSEDDMGTAIRKNYPELGSLNKIAAAKNSQRLSTQLGSLYPSAKPAAPRMNTNVFSALPDASIATPEGNARRSAIWDSQDRADAGSRAAGVSLATPQTPQDLGRNSQLMRTMSPTERDAAFLKTQLMPGTPDAKTAEQNLTQHGTEGMNPVLGMASDAYRKYAQEPYLGPALDETVQGLRRVFHDPRQPGPAPLTPINPNDPAEHFGTKMIPELLAPHNPTPGTMEPNEPWYKAGARAVGRGGYEALQGLSTPESMAVAAGFGVAPESRLAKLGQGIFTGEAIKSAGEGAYSGAGKLATGDVYGGVHDLTGAAVNSLFGALGGAEMLHDTRARIASDTLRNDPAPIVQSEAAKHVPVTEPEVTAPPITTPAKPKIDFSKLPKGKPNPVTSTTGTSIVPASARAVARTGIEVESNFPVQTGKEEAWKAAANNPSIAEQFKRTGLSGFSIDAPHKFGLSEQGNISRSSGKISINANAVDPENVISHEISHEIYNRLSPENKQVIDKYLDSNPDIQAQHAGGDEERIVDHFAQVMQGKTTVPAEIHKAFFKSKLSDRVATAPQTPAPAAAPRPSSKTWADVDKSGGYIKKEDDLEDLVKTGGDRMLVIKDVNGGRHVVPASMASTLLKNDRFSGNVSSISVKSGNPKVGPPQFDGEILNYLPDMARGAVEAIPSLREAVVKAAPGLESKIPQAQNPSLPSPKETRTEGPLRQLVSSAIRTRQLSESAQNRFNVEQALHAARSGEEENELPIAKPLSKETGELSPDDTKIVQSVASTLGKTPGELAARNYRLTDAEIKQLKQSRAQGLRPLSIENTGHPEEAFGAAVPHPLADINFANAKAAGIPNAKDLWSKLSPADREARKNFMAQQVGRMSEEDLAQNVSTSTEGTDDIRKAITSSDREARQKGQVTSGAKDIETLRFEHDMMQKVLAGHLSKVKAKIREILPAWQQERADADTPSSLAQDISALGDKSKAVIPKELYAQKHLTTQARQSSTGSVLPKSVPSTEASEIGKTPQVSTPTKNAKSESGEVLTHRKVQFYDSGTEQDFRSRYPDHIAALSKVLTEDSPNVYMSPRSGRSGQLGFVDRNDPVVSVVPERVEQVANKFVKELGVSKSRALEEIYREVVAHETVHTKQDLFSISGRTTKNHPLEKEAYSKGNIQNARKRLVVEGAKNNNSRVLAGIQTLADKIQNDHGEQAFGALPTIFDAVNAKFKNPENVNKALYGAMRAYKANLAAGIEEPLNKALADTIDKMPKESSTQSTVYANPIGPLIQKIFGKRQTALLPQASNPLIKLPESPISKFTETLEQRNGSSNNEIAKAFLNNEINHVKDFVTNIPKFTAQSFEAIKAMTGAAWQAYKDRGGLSPFEWALGNRRLELSANAIVMHEFHNRILKMHPDETRRTAMVNYLQASGGIMSDRAVNAQLQQKANAFAPSSAQNRKLQQGYVDAQNLTPAEKQTIQEYRAYDAHLNQQEAAQGLELHARENYIRQIWSKDSFARKQIDAVFSAGSFTVNPSFTRMRKFEDYFEGEQSGFTPHRKDFAYLVSARARASAEVLANRSLIENLYNEKMPDGSKMAQVSGIGNSVTINDPAYPNVTDSDKKGALFIKGAAKDADSITADGRPYVAINHPSFQNWKWVGQVADPKTGETVEALYKGSMLAHPDVADQIKRILEPSALRNGALGQAMKPLLGASSIGKQTLLIGLFHPIQLGIHALEHAAEGSTSSNAMSALNPFSSKKFIDLENNVQQQQLVIHGLKVAEYNGESLWDEGVMSHGLAAGAPVVGKFLRSVHEAMFSKYIPNLKMAMAEDALGRNMGRYHDTYAKEELAKLAANNVVGQKAAGFASQNAQSRIMRMTAEQMNSAFGGINWDSLPVNKTWQDIARLTVLAPDFLLARMQFVGDSLRPGGMESRKALLIGAFVQYTAARAFNAAMNDGDPKWDIHDWNKFIAGKHEFSLRTVQGDLVDSLIDTRKFISYRLNPITLRPALEAITGKDVFGHPVTAGQELMDFAKNVVPMPAQGLFDAAASKANSGFRNAKQDDTIVSTIIQSLVGMHVKQYRTPAERSVFEDFDKIQGPPTTDSLALEQKNTFRSLRDKYREGKLTDEDLVGALNKPGGNVKESEVRYIFKTAKETQLVTRARHLEFNQVMSAFNKGSLAEKMELTPILRTKSKTLTPEEREKVQDKLDDFQENLSDQQNEKLHDQIQQELEYEYPTPPDQQEQQ